MREGLREIGRSTLGLVKWLLGSALIHAAIVAGVLLLGLTIPIDRWIREHNISPSLLIAATAFVTVHVARAGREQEPQQRRPLQRTDRDPEPPAPVS
jgi:hypothetical protein